MLNIAHYSVQSLIHVQLFVTLWTTACQIPPSMGFSRQEHWSGLLCLPPGDLPDPRMEPTSLVSPAFTTSAAWEALRAFIYGKYPYYDSIF